MDDEPRGLSSACAAGTALAVTALALVVFAVGLHTCNRYSCSVRSSEAIQTVGAISRAAQAAYERENACSDCIDPPPQRHSLCGSAVPVPLIVGAGRRHQPAALPGVDFDTGDAATGWRCMRFALTEAHSYQYW